MKERKNVQRNKKTKIIEKERNSYRKFKERGNKSRKKRQRKRKTETELHGEKTLFCMFVFD